MNPLVSVSLILAISAMTAEDPAPAPRDDTLAQPAPAGAVLLFDGKDLASWRQTRGDGPASWTVEDKTLVVRPGAGDIVTRDSFEGDFSLHLEFNVPYMPQAQGQGRGNSGVYLQGRYELQVLDSHGLVSRDNDCGGIYKQHAPAVNACKPPLQWQTYDIDFTAPVLEGEKVVRKARVTVRQNGLLIHDDVEIEPTPGGVDSRVSRTGPLLLQDHGNLVQFRNIWLSHKP